MFWKKWKNNKKFQKAEQLSLDARTNPVNPGRGWYHIYTFSIAAPDEEQLRWLPFYETETLALLRLDIGGFRESALNPEAESYIHSIFKVFQKHQKEIILRVCYDTQGQGMAHEPMSFALVKTHIRQVGKIALEYAQNICVAQGLFVGSWGEMHTSRYLAKQQLQTMAELWQEATEGKIKLAVRKPVFLRMIEAQVPAGFYNDAMFGSENDLGTFGSKMRTEASWEEPWVLEDETAYLKEANSSIPAGGEVLAGEVYTAEAVIQRLLDMGVTYLNSVHDAVRLKEWKACVLPTGESLYDYIDRHLGYCFVVTKVQWKKETLFITIANKGFAPIYDEVLLYAEYGGERMVLPNVITGLLPNEDRTIEISGKESGKIKLGMQRKKDSACIRFANGQTDTLLALGEILEKREKLCQQSIL